MPNNGEKCDITSKRITFNLRNLFIGGTFLFLTGGAGTAAWLDLKAGVKEAAFQSQQNERQIIALRCDVFQIRNTMEQIMKKLPALPTPRECQ